MNCRWCLCRALVLFLLAARSISSSALQGASAAAQELTDNNKRVLIISSLDSSSEADDSSSSSRSSPPEDASQTRAHPDGIDDDNETDSILRILTFDYPGRDLMGMDRRAKSYYEKTGIRITYEKLPDFVGLHEEIKSQAENHLPLYDGYICGPAIVGAAVQHDGFMDLTDTVRTSEVLEWQDVLLGFREKIAVYNNQVRMLPLDGDAHFLFYRQDVLDAFGQKVPRTWEEYWRVARTIHGRKFQNKTMVGSCVGRMKAFQGSYWASLVLSSYTQTKGPTQGHLLDPNDDMEPLAGEALAEAIKMLELQAIYGHPDEFESYGGGGENALNVQAMNNGYCALTYNWGDSFTGSQYPGSLVKDKMQVAPTPGSTTVYNRLTRELEPCTEELCGGDSGTYYEDIGWVNRAAYLAFGGWSAAVNNNIDDNRKQKIVDFFSYMTSPAASLETAIPPAGTPANQSTGVDAYRASHLDPDVWALRGYDRDSAESYTNTVKEIHHNPNTVVDMRFAGADRIATALDAAIFDYLKKAVKEDSLPEADNARHFERLKVAESLASTFRDIIREENAKPETLVPVGVQYQLDLGIYKPPIDHQYIGKVRVVGWCLAVIIIATSIYFAGWVCFKREARVVKGSQPIFLLLICLGTSIMASAIFPLGMDDDFFDKVESEDCPECDAACKSWPWLVFIGFTVIFSAIFSKLSRITRIIAKANRYAKNIKVETRDVMMPFVALLSLNVILLTTWTIVDPLEWQRIFDGELRTYGSCQPENGTPATILGCLLGVTNLGALLLAEVEAYKARNISDHLSESKYIGLATVSMFQMFVIGIPVIFLVRDKPEAQYFVYSGIIFVICSAILSLIFIPKIHFDKYPPPKASLSSADVGLTIQVSHDDKSDADAGEDESALELIRLRHAVQEYRDKYLECKDKYTILTDHLEDHGIMNVTDFFAQLERDKVALESQVLIPEDTYPGSNFETPRFWRNSGCVTSEDLSRIETTARSTTEKVSSHEQGNNNLVVLGRDSSREHLESHAEPTDDITKYTEDKDLEHGIQLSAAHEEKETEQ